MVEVGRQRAMPAEVAQAEEVKAKPVTVQQIKSQIQEVKPAWEAARADAETKNEIAAYNRISEHLKKAEDSISFFPKQPASAKKELEKFRRQAKLFLKSQYYEKVTTTGQAFGKEADRAKAQIDKRLDHVMENLAQRKVKDAKSDLAFYEKNAGVFFKGLERKMLMKGSETILDPISKGTAAHLNQKLDEAFKNVQAENPIAATESIKDYEKSAKVALQLAEIRLRLEGTEKLIGKENHRKYGKIYLERGMKALKDGNVKRAEAYVKFVNKQVRGILIKEERKLMHDIRAMPGGPTRNEREKLAHRIRTAMPEELRIATEQRPTEEAVQEEAKEEQRIRTEQIKAPADEIKNLRTMRPIENDVQSLRSRIVGLGRADLSNRIAEGAAMAGQAAGREERKKLRGTIRRLA